MFIASGPGLQSLNSNTSPQQPLPHGFFLDSSTISAAGWSRRRDFARVPRVMLSF